MTEEQEKEVELRVRERLFEERLKQIDQWYKWTRTVFIVVAATALGLALLDSLVTCEARRVVREELRK
jgi:hypothetical protein